MHKLHIKNGVSVAILGGLLSLSSVTVNAETLEAVLATAYQTNPEISSERAKLRALDEENPRARSGYRPKLNFDADITSQRVHTRPPQASDGRRRHGGYNISLIQPLFRGLRTINSIAKADADIYAGREDLRFVEQNIFLDAVTSYVDVIRDRALVRLRRSNVGVISKQLKATNDRFKVGEVTKTDVAQAKARHARAVSELNLSQANLKTSRALFEQVVGHKPNRLRAPRGIIRYLPRSLNGSLKRGLDEHPSILGSTYREIAATHTIQVIRGELLPEINLEGSYGERFHPARGVRKQSTTIVKGTFKMPIYAGGEISARVRQAKQTVLRRRQELRTSRRLIKADIIASWGQVSSNRAKLIADRSQVSATTTALEGVREEEKVGQRTVLNVLDAQQELLDAKVTIAITKRDLVVARYRLLASTGRLSAVELGLRVNRYEPADHYNQVERKWFGRKVEGYNDNDGHRSLVSDRLFGKRYK